MIPAVTKTPPNSRPHAFGRSSNIWQYLDLVHDRNTLPSGEQTLSTFSESSNGDDSEEEESLASTNGGGDHRRGNDAMEQGRGGHRGSHEGKTGSRGSKGSIADNDGSFKQHSRIPNRLSSPAIGSLPDLHQPGRLREQQGSRKTLAISTSSPSALIGAGLRVVGGSNFNSAEIMKRLNALGTSVSTPVLPPASPTNHGHANENSGPNLLQNAFQAGQGGGSTQGTTTPMTLAAPGVSGPAANTSAPVMAAAANIVQLSDAEKLRNAFNSQASRLSYGCSVALELFNGHLMMVGSPDGQVRVQSLEKLQMPQVKGYKDRAIITLLDLADVRSAGSIRYGDSVWLQLSVGPGDVSWEQGGVLGAKVREAPQLKALGLLNDDSIRNDVQAPASVGYPIPVTAYLPKSRDDGDMQVDEIQSRLRNKSAKMLGKWIIRSAVCQRRKQKDNFVYNNDEVYLEQDWFYLGADSDAGVAVLRQLPPAIAGKDINPGEYVVERRGAWKLRLLDSSSGSAGLSLAQQQMERLLLRAKSQLKQSQRMRSGQTKVYGPNLRGGTGFTAQLRSQVAASTRQTESRYADRQEWRLKRIDQHMSEKARSMNVAIGFEDSTVLTRRGSSRPNSGLSASENSARRESGAVAVSERPQRRDSLRHSSSVDVIGTGRRQSNASSPRVDKNVNQAERNSTKPSSARSTTSLPGASSSVSSCGLCHSSSIGYNLCCQFRDVMQVLEQERLVENVGTRNDHNATLGETTSFGVAPGTKRTARGRVGRTARSDDVVATTTVSSNFLGRDAGSRDTVRRGADAMADTRGTTPLMAHNASPQAQQLNDRVLQLFAKEDAAMVGLIKYKEKEAHRAMYADTQARAGLSPVAAHFRERFKHIGIFMQMHRQQQQAQQDGIGGHYQKLHADLYSAGSRARAADDFDPDYDSEDDYGDSEGSVDDPDQALEPQQASSMPPEEPRKQSDESIPPDTERLFPTTEELEHLTPVDTKAALVLYVQNRTAMAEMLDGYAELVDTQMIPTLKSSLTTRNRGALVEALDFVARSSEFVCARRVQVFVAKLLHAVAESDVGDFTSFQKEFDELVVELQGAVNFIRFFLQTRASRRKDKHT
ncbi:hypothetical protein KRP22_006985 [Phytophthora ramorum]|nr:hypothetical protein KRP22_1918 [Phytophthora ramorum]